MIKKLTQKQEDFCKLVVELGNQAESYRQSYNSKSSPQVCAVEASKLVASPNIALRLKELRELAQERHNVTVDSLLKELEEARTIAATCETPQSSAMISATMGKAKLCGLDKQIIETTIRVADDGTNEW
tara:strand:- start:4628 stop:5014 length:387 start_codon:yes stop_codon:yes gene_type:complete